MKFKLLEVCSSLSIVMLLVNNVYAVGLSDLTGAVETLQTGIVDPEIRTKV